MAESRRTVSARLVVPSLDGQDLLAQVDVAPFEASELSPDVAGPLPEKDWPVLAAAMRLQCETLVTGGRRHFGALYGKTVNGVSIHSPRSLAEAVLMKKR